jgi:hypothetical protein
MMLKRKGPTKRKRSLKRKPQKIVPDEPLNPFQEYGNSSPHNLTHEIRSEIDDGNRELEDLLNAIHAIDRFGVRRPRPDKKPLIELLMSRSTTLAENKLVADLIDRHILPKRGRPRRPVYVITHDDHILSNAIGDVDELRARGFSRIDAIARVAERLDITYDKLDDAYSGRRRSMRKKK